MLKKNLFLVLSELHLYSLSFDDPSISGLPWKCYQILCVPCPPAWPTGTASCSCSFVKLYSSFLSNFTSCRTLRPVPFLCFAHTLSTIPLHGKLVIKNPLKAWLRMAVHNGSITVLVIKPSGRVMSIYFRFINYTFPQNFTTTSQVSLLELGGAGHFDSEMLTFNWGQWWRETYLTALHRLTVIRNFQMCKLWLKLPIHAREKLDC